MLKNTLTLLFILTVFFSCDKNMDSKEILFVCPHGAARSPIAAAYFNKMASEKNLNYHAIFRGTEPDETLSARTIKGLTEDGIDIKGWKPEIVSKKDTDKAYKIVTFDCVVPTTNAATTEAQWNGTPSPSKEFESYQKLVKEKVKALIETLPKN